MPIFEYRCEKCGCRFEDLVPVGDRDKPRKCPSCGARKVTREVSTFAARMAGGSNSPSCSPGGST